MCSFLSFLKGRAIQLVKINFEFMKKNEATSLSKRHNAPWALKPNLLQ